MKVEIEVPDAVVDYIAEHISNMLGDDVKAKLQHIIVDVIREHKESNRISDSTAPRVTNVTNMRIC